MDCRKGYFGDFCDEPCPPGSFGFKCGGRCFPSCNIKLCNHVSGCSNNNEYTSFRSYTEAYTVERTNQRTCTSCTTSTPSKISAIVITEDRKIEIDRKYMYLIAGGSVLISLILFVLLLELYKRKRSTTTRTTPKRKTCEETGTSEESNEQFEPQHGMEHASRKTTSKKSNLNQPVECDYHDIDEVIEIRQVRNHPIESQNYELPRLLSDS